MIFLQITASANESMTKTSLEIHENTIVNEIKRTMFGVSSDWVTDYLKRNFYGNGNDMTKINSDMKKFLAESGFEIPVFRIGGGSANEFLWKNYLTKSESGVKSFGIPELLNGVTEVDPNACISVTLNILNDTDDNLLDLIRFLTLDPNDLQAVGSDGVNWAEERVKRGRAKPYPIFNVVLGNELDWLGGLDDKENLNWSAEKYISVCNRIIPKIREVNPNVKIGVFSKTATNGFEDNGRAWDETVIKALGPKVEYIVQHLYYHFADAAIYEQSGYDYDNIKSFISEEFGTAHCKIFLEEHGMYADWTDSGDYPRIMSFEGMMATAMFYCRRLKDSTFDGAAFHGFVGENPVDDNTFTMCSEVAQAYESTPYMLTGAGKIIKFFCENTGEFAVQSEMKSSETGLFKDSVYNTYLSKRNYAKQTPDAKYAARYPSINTLVTTAENGGLNIITANREENITHENISVSFDNGPYRLKEKTVITASDYTANITAQTPDAVTIETTKYTDNTAFTKYTVNPHEIVVLKLEPLNLNKTVSNVEIKNIETKDYKNTVNSPFGRIIAKCDSTAADDDLITFKVLKQNTMPESVEKSGEYAVAEITVTAKTARSGTAVDMPETADKGKYVLVAGNLENSLYDYVSTEFVYDTEAQENGSLSAVTVQCEENGKIKVGAEINPENRFSKYTYLIYKDNVATPEKIENLVNMGQITRTGDYLEFTADMPKDESDNGTYTIFVGNGEKNIAQKVFEYIYEPPQIKEIYVDFDTDSDSAVTANISFSESVEAGEIFTAALVKPGYKLVSNENDLENIVYIDTVKNSGYKQNIKITLPKEYPNGSYVLMINGQDGLKNDFPVNVDGGADIFIEGNLKNENGDAVNEQNINAVKSVFANVYSTEPKTVSAVCALYEKNGTLSDICINNDFVLSDGITNVKFDFKNICPQTSNMKIFVWDSAKTITPLAKYVGVYNK